MATKELLDYISKARKENINDETLKASLLAAGWQEPQVNEAIKSFNTVQRLEVPKPPSSKVFSGNSMWDSFEHILMFISMYVVYIALALLIHLFIDKWFPSAANDPYNYNTFFSYYLLRGYMAALIVAFPLFAFFFLRITKRTLDNPTIRTLKSRKFLIYATLIITFIVVLINIATAVYGFLNGNVGINFFLHFLNTVSISSIIFVYYLGQVKEDRTIYA